MRKDRYFTPSWCFDLLFDTNFYFNIIIPNTFVKNSFSGQKLNRNDKLREKRGEKSRRENVENIDE